MNDKPATNQTPSANASKSVQLQLPYRPHVAAGWKIPGVGTYKIKQWLEQARAVNAWEENRKSLSDPQLRKEFLSLIYRAKSGEPLETLLAESRTPQNEYAALRCSNLRWCMPVPWLYFRDANR
jgi:hypothetical protein